MNTKTKERLIYYKRIIFSLLKFIAVRKVVNVPTYYSEISILLATVHISKIMKT